MISRISPAAAVVLVASLALLGWLAWLFRASLEFQHGIAGMLLLALQVAQAFLPQLLAAKGGASQ
jgi:hypothetical protein